MLQPKVTHSQASSLGYCSFNIQSSPDRRKLAALRENGTHCAEILRLRHQSLVVFQIGFHCVALAGLEHPGQPRLASNSRDPLASQVLGLKKCDKMASSERLDS